jgi:hypothetical protein
MQNSELFRRGVVLPHTSAAEASLRANDVDATTPVEFLAIPDQQFFEVLWELQVFHDINVRTGSLIDDYEECFIEQDALNKVVSTIDLIRTKSDAQTSNVASFLTTLSILAEKGRELGRPLLFVL